MINKSLTRKLIIVFSAILVTVVVLNMVINGFLLSKLYLNKKLDSMNAFYQSIFNEYENNKGEKAIEIVKEALSEENLRVFVWDDEFNLVIDSLPLLRNENTDNYVFNASKKHEEEAIFHREMPTEDLMFQGKKDWRKNNDGFHKQETMEIRMFNASLKSEDIITENDNYTLFSFSIGNSNEAERTYCIRGNLPNGYKILIQMPISSISQAVVLSNKLLLFVGVFMLIIGIIIVAITSKNIVKPIKEMSYIAHSMESLDFSRKCDYDRDDEIGSLGNSINSLSSKLELTISELYDKNKKLEEDILLKNKIDNMRKEFIANASHELKTPVALISGYAEGLRDNIAADSDSKELYTNVILEETDRMEKIIHQMLDLMEIDSVEAILDGMEFSVSSLTRDVISSFDLTIKSRDINMNFSCEGECVITGDYKRIYQAVTNYISNAINHVDKEKIINVNLFDLGDSVKVSVFNTGEPVPESDIQNIWERFYKVDKSHLREFGGTGLGLAIVRSVVELHHGEYGVQNLPNGVEFYFTIKKERTNES